MGDSLDGEPTRWYRNRYHAAWTRDIPRTLPAVGGLILATGLLATGVIHGGTVDEEIWVASGFAVTASGAYLRFLGSRAGIGVGTAGVTVRPLIGHVHSLPWADVERFDQLPGRRCLYIAVVSRSGEALHTGGCSFGGGGGGQETAKMTRMISTLEMDRHKAQVRHPD